MAEGDKINILVWEKNPAIVNALLSAGERVGQKGDVTIAGAYHEAYDAIRSGHCDIVLMGDLPIGKSPEEIRKHTGDLLAHAQTHNVRVFAISPMVKQGFGVVNSTRPGERPDDAWKRVHTLATTPREAVVNVTRR